MGHVDQSVLLDETVQADFIFHYFDLEDNYRFCILYDYVVCRFLCIC